MSSERDRLLGQLGVVGKRCAHMDDIDASGLDVLERSHSGAGAPLAVLPDSTVPTCPLTQR